MKRTRGSSLLFLMNKTFFSSGASVLMPFAPYSALGHMAGT